MKILHVIESYGGGALTSVNQLCNAFCTEHEVVLAHGIRAETPAHFASLLDPRIRRIELSLTREISPRNDMAGLAALYQLFKREKPDVIHLHSSKAGFLGRAAARAAGMQHKVLYSPRGYAFLRNDVSEKKRLFYHLLEKTASHLAGTIVGCSRGEYAEALKLTANAVCVQNAIDLRVLDYEVRGIKKPVGKPLTIVTSGRLSAAKRPELFAEVARLVSARADRPVEFLWVGGGEVALPEGPAKATGWLKREDALRTLKAQGAVFLMTSAYEGLPLAMLEAQALGLPVVATDVVGNRDALLPGSTGFLGNTAEELAEHVLRLVASPDLLKTMSQAARQFIETEHSLPVMRAAYVPLYWKAANNVG